MDNEQLEYRKKWARDIIIDTQTNPAYFDELIKYYEDKIKRLTARLEELDDRPDC